MGAQQLTNVPVLDTQRAAEYVGTTPNNLRLSRHTGILFGKPSPEFIVAGSKRLYRVKVLDHFLNSLETFSTTAEANLARSEV